MTNEEIEAFFREYVDGFMWHDVEAAIKGKANYVAALALLSYTEVLGGFIDGTLGIKYKAGGQFAKGLAKMKFKANDKYYRDFKVKLRDTSKSGAKPEEMGPWEIFRCGLAHEFFAKGIATVANTPPEGDHAAKAVKDIHPDRAGIEWRKLQTTDPSEHLVFFTNGYYRDLRDAFARQLVDIKANANGEKDAFERAHACVHERELLK
jgi:hypothetical protein